jgi:cell division protein FtsI (penicillin-binding protein 3)
MNASVNQRRTRVGVITFGLAGLFVVAILRLVALITMDGTRLDLLARDEHAGVQRLAPVRGPIVDRNGEPLALSTEMRSICAWPHRVVKSSTPADRARLAAAIGIGADALEAELAKSAHFVWLARRIAPEKAAAAEALGIEGVTAVTEYKRFYPESNLAAGVVGLAGMDGQGLSGLELEYDSMVRGAPVELSVYHDALGRSIYDNPLALKAAEPGAQLELTIDSSIQSLAETELANEVVQAGAKRGAAIVIDPFTGELVAMANVSATPDGVHDRLHNAAVQDAFEPGSTMKGILASIALADGTMDTSRQIYCENGKWNVARRTIHDDSKHGWLDLGGIIEVSSNIGAAKIALGLGSQRFYDGLRAFGLGSRTGIDLPGEASGLLRKADGWREIDLANHGFGQGVAVTPIQLAVAYSAIANGGNVIRPHIVRAAFDAEGREILEHPPQVVRRAIAPDVAHQMNLLLRNVVNGNDGTGRRARVDGFLVAGKTGTAQMVNPENGSYFQNRHVSSFVGFLPADDPRLLILVVLYDVGHGHFGGLVAAPVFSEIASGAVRDLNITPTDPNYETASMIPMPKPAHTVSRRGVLALSDATDDVVPVLTGSNLIATTPDFTGMSLRRAIEAAKRLHAAIEINGSGYVVAQEPAPGAPLNHAAIRLTLAGAGDEPIRVRAAGAITKVSYNSGMPR